jgi:hypothetical protein
VLALTWVDGSEAIGAILTAAAVVAGAVFAVMYGRRATVTISAEVHRSHGRVILAARPSVCAVGLFRLRFHEPEGAGVVVTEVIATDEPYVLADGRHWNAEFVFGPSFVEGGETLTTTVTFDLGPLPPNVAGWRVSLGIDVTRILSDWSWADQVFVPVPAVATQA